MKVCGIPAGTLQAAKKMILEEGAPCVFIQNDQILAAGEGTGVQPLLAALAHQPELLRGTVLVDRIVGKAAAMLAVLGGTAGVYGLTMSGAAREFLERRGVFAGCEYQVGRIINRQGTGLCPMEQSVLGTEDPEQAYRAILETVRRLSGGVKGNR